MFRKKLTYKLYWKLDLADNTILSIVKIEEDYTNYLLIILFLYLI